MQNGAQYVSEMLYFSLHFIAIHLYFTVTEDLVRKKAEHNEKIIGTLEELSLHQEDVHKIENVQHWCKHLEILYLQSNLIPKIGKFS